MLITPPHFEPCTKVVAPLLIAMGLTGIWESQLEAGFTELEPSPKELSRGVLSLVSGRAQQQPERKEIADSGHEGGEFVFSKAEAQEAGRRIEDAITKTK